MSDNAPLRVVLCWHMHQPQYLDRESGQYQLPWTYLHAIKDYIDMAAIIAETPGARAVVNFAPILLEQLDDYAQQISGYLRESRPLHDPLLAALACSALPADNKHRLALIKACLKANRERLIERFEPYRLLADLAGCINDTPAAVAYFDDQYLHDLLVWYHIAWLGETVRREDGRVRSLVEKGSRFNQHDRLVLLELIGELLGDVVPRYRALAQNGQVELATSPYAHPIVPLLLDLGSAREAIPEVKLPHLPAYPGGEARARWHIEEGNRVFERYFHFRPVGCWPSEGSVSRAALDLFAEEGYRWVATGQSVLGNSLERSGLELGCIHRPYRVEGSDITCFFRDDGLSDLIGFSYADWHADDAVANLIHHLENIAGACEGEPNRVVSIILDGENAWEYYPENGYHFLTALYKQLSEHAGFELTTFSECLEAGLEPQPMKSLVAGSWVYGTFSTWIGDADKNRGWDLLGDAKKAFDAAVAEGRLSGERLAAAEQQLAYCEGSDWFWWFGDYNPSESVHDFERLYRLHLASLYRMIGEEPPDTLTRVLSHGGGRPATGGVMRRGQG